MTIGQRAALTKILGDLDKAQEVITGALVAYDLFDRPLPTFRDFSETHATITSQQGGSTMAGLYGVEESKKIVVSVAKVANVVDALIAKKGLLVLLGVVEPIETLKTVDLAALLAELKEYDPADRLTIEDAFKAQLQLTNTALEAKIEAGVSVLEEVVSLVGEAIVVYEKARALFLPVPAL